MIDTPAFKDLALGTLIMILALLTWRITGNFWAWLVFFIPGSFYIIKGLIGAIKDR
jgi:hypothetical protein